MSFIQRIKSALGRPKAPPTPRQHRAADRRREVGQASARAQSSPRNAAAIKKALGEALQDTMLQAGRLSAEYTFKVLTTVGDQAKHVLVVNLSREMGGGQEQLAAAERLVALLAKARYELAVTAVYWRVAPLVTRANEAYPTLSAAASALRPPAAKPAPLPQVQRRPKFYDDEPGYRDSDFPSTRAQAADSDLMGLYP